MSESLTEHDLDMIVYVMDVWLQSNESHPAHNEVEALVDRLSRCNGLKLKG